MRSSAATSASPGFAASPRAVASRGAAGRRPGSRASGGARAGRAARRPGAPPGRLPDEDRQRRRGREPSARRPAGPDCRRAAGLSRRSHRMVGGEAVRLVSVVGTPPLGGGGAAPTRRSRRGWNMHARAAGNFAGLSEAGSWRLMDQSSTGRRPSGCAPAGGACPPRGARHRGHARHRARDGCPPRRARWTPAPLHGRDPGRPAAALAAVRAASAPAAAPALYEADLGSLAGVRRLAAAPRDRPRRTGPRQRGRLRPGAPRNARRPRAPPFAVNVVAPIPLSVARRVLRARGAGAHGRDRARPRTGPARSAPRHALAAPVGAYTGPRA